MRSMKKDIIEDKIQFRLIIKVRKEELKITLIFTKLTWMMCEQILTNKLALLLFFSRCIFLLVFNQFLFDSQFKARIIKVLKS